MFKTLFQYPRVLSRHADAPLAHKRKSFLKHLASRGTPRSTLLRYARQLRVIAGMLESRLPGSISKEEIVGFAQRWANGQRRRGRAKGRRWSKGHFVQVANAWCAFMGWLKQEKPPPPAFCARVDAWARFLSEEEGLSARTVANYRWWAAAFLGWIQEQEVPLRRVTLLGVDEFMERLSARGLSRVSLATGAKRLRRFFRYTYQRGWCRRDLEPGVLSPRLYRQETLPGSPAWPDVKRLIAASEGPGVCHLRNRAMLLLVAVYGLRSGEVRGLSLADLDWQRRILRVRRSKTARVQEYPLSQATGQALRRYLKEGRPECSRGEIFVTLQAPFRPLSAGALYAVTCSLMERLQIASPKRGPHALRHACASHLLNSGLPLKEVGDHLGHRHLGSTQIYAKVDLAGLRAVAAFDLGGVQ